MRWHSIALFFLLLAPLRAADLVFVSFNVENYLESEGDQPTQGPFVKSEAAINAIVKVLVSLKPDVVGLMEMGSQKTLTDLQGRLRAQGLDLPNAEWVAGADQERHLALLSRFPIAAHDSQDYLPFDLAGKPERMTRGILDITIEPEPGYALRLIGVHLKSRRTVSYVDQGDLRLAESRRLLTYVRGILTAAPSTNLLLFGDFNDTKNEAPIREVLGGPEATRLRDIWLKDDHGETWTHYWKIADSYSRIDYLFYSKGLASEIIRSRSGIYSGPDWFDASDHRAIYTTISAKDR